MSNDWRSRAQAPDQALEYVKSGMRLFVHGAAATPSPLLDALARRWYRDRDALRRFTTPTPPAEALTRTATAMA